MTDPQAEATYMWTQELYRNIQEEGDRQDIPGEERGRNGTYRERASSARDSKTGAEKEVKAELGRLQKFTERPPLSVLLAVSPCSAPNESNS